MPNTKSAEKRTRSTVRRAARNRSVKSRLRTLERNFLKVVEGSAGEDASTALRLVSSALDKAAKVGVITSGTASRKRSRLQLRLNARGAAATAA
jgi:small subunit ribosomal protein S20